MVLFQGLVSDSTSNFISYSQLQLHNAFQETALDSSSKYVRQSQVQRYLAPAVIVTRSTRPPNMENIFNPSPVSHNSQGDPLGQGMLRIHRSSLPSLGENRPLGRLSLSGNIESQPLPSLPRQELEISRYLEISSIPILVPPFQSSPDFLIQPLACRQHTLTLDI